MRPRRKWATTPHSRPAMPPRPRAKAPQMQSPRPRPQSHGTPRDITTPLDSCRDNEKKSDPAYPHYRPEHRSDPRPDMPHEPKQPKCSSQAPDPKIINPPRQLCPRRKWGPRQELSQRLGPIARNAPLDLSSPNVGSRPKSHAILWDITLFDSCCDNEKNEILFMLIRAQNTEVNSHSLKRYM